MEQKDIVDFLQKIADQIGPAGQEAFRIVAARVFAESLIWVVVGSIILATTLILTFMCVFAYRKIDGAQYKSGEEQTFWVFICGAVLVFGLMFSIIMIVPNGMNLLSIDYATIERILNLVGKAT